MLLAPNLGHRILSGVTPRGLPHPAFLVLPHRIEDVDDLRSPSYVRFHRIESPFKRPPLALLNAALAATWSLDLDISYGAATLAASGTIITLSTNIGDRCGADYTDTASYSDSDSAGDDSLSIDISIGDLSDVAYGRVLGQWSLPLFITVSASTSGDDSVSSIYRLGVTVGTSPGSAYGGISIDFCGESATLYDNGDTSAAPTGTIALSPASWLPRL